MKKSRKAHDYDCIALACQGGGSLGAYHIGALKAMEAADYSPDIIAGISIGAFTAAIIAGNEPQNRVSQLNAFWKEIAWPDFFRVPEGLADLKKWHNQFSSYQGFLFGQPSFFMPRFPTPPYQPAGSLGATSFYDTAALETTLAKYVDFDLINVRKKARLILGATHVRNGHQHFFDSRVCKLNVTHVVASGAMPPGFPGTSINGQLYWDGGCLSNTPLDGIYDAAAHKNTLCFMIDLFGPNGQEPQNMDEVLLTIKELQFSSRTRNQSRQVADRHYLAHLLHHVVQQKPAGRPRLRQVTKQLHEAVAPTLFDILHIIYRKPPSEVPTCDCEFSQSSILARSDQGCRDMERALRKMSQLHREHKKYRKLHAIGSVVRTFADGHLLDSYFPNSTKPSGRTRRVEQLS
ncbi:patatin-like phospholipase family protein [Pedosphaera parvula]|uniref:Patatin n=1 Tax=Pedosphaera parvula (strain Ellin514) TaxID=320771 RepID=B9XPQ4_PEDPL|nr:patatin-like phospholipase family protein [Pedosphaera parvula]EEF58177.1 Patatin [Pedosphaera parvula Ellin514]